MLSFVKYLAQKVKREQRKVGNEDLHDVLLYKVQFNRYRAEFYANEL